MSASVEMYNGDGQCSGNHLKPISESVLVAKVAPHSRRETVRLASTDQHQLIITNNPYNLFNIALFIYLAHSNSMICLEHSIFYLI